MSMNKVFEYCALRIPIVLPAPSERQKRLLGEAWNAPVA